MKVNIEEIIKKVPRTESTVSVATQVTIDVKNRLDSYCRANSIRKGALLRAMIMELLNNVD